MGGGGGAGWPQQFSMFKKKKGGGGGEVLPCLEWGGDGGQQVLDSQFSHFVAPLPVINDRSLTKSHPSSSSSHKSPHSAPPPILRLSSTSNTF